MIPREQVVNCLRGANYKFQRKADRVEIYRQRGTGQRVNLSLRDLCSEEYVRIVLSQAGLKVRQIDEFLRTCIKAS